MQLLLTCYLFTFFPFHFELWHKNLKIFYFSYKRIIFIKWKDGTHDLGIFVIMIKF